MDKILPVEIRGLLRAFIVSFILCLFSATVIYFSGLSEALLASLGKIALIVGVFCGACYVSSEYGNKGLVRGMNMGLIFFILMLIATLIFNSSLISLKNFIYTLLICISSGTIGGILGIGLSDKTL